ncbi:MAG: PRC-barrel domain-containing protein [Verrucomicrobia bacterium]|nr:PRC-barrel domain-containing protein [Verrucomicrobiota bacterium]
MLRKAKTLKGFHLGAMDGEIGHVKDFYFDDASWKVRYIVADTGKWLPHRKVLISPLAVGSIDAKHHVINVQLTKNQVEESPTIEADKPVSRQMEEDYLRYFGWPFYWLDPLMWGAPVAAGPVETATEETAKGDPHLRSTEEVIGYHLQARDGEIGHVEDFLFDEEDWSIQELIVDTRNWLPGKRVLVSPLFIKSVNWAESSVQVRLTREALKSDLPEYHPPDEDNPDESILHAYSAGRTFPLP